MDPPPYQGLSAHSGKPHPPTPERSHTFATKSRLTNAPPHPRQTPSHTLADNLSPPPQRVEDSEAFSSTGGGQREKKQKLLLQYLRRKKKKKSNFVFLFCALQTIMNLREVETKP